MCQHDHIEGSGLDIGSSLGLGSSHSLCRQGRLGLGLVLLLHCHCWLASLLLIVDCSLRLLLQLEWFPRRPLLKEIQQVLPLTMQGCMLLPRLSKGRL